MSFLLLALTTMTGAEGPRSAVAYRLPSPMERR